MLVLETIAKIRCAHSVDGNSIKRISLGEAALAALDGYAGAAVWFAGERKEARRLRETAKAAGWEAAKLRISGFLKAEADA